MNSSTRNLETTLKAESTLDNLLMTMNQADCSKAESMESLLGVLCLMINGESLDRLMTAGSASRLPTLVRSVARFSAQAQESQGESVKNSLLRAAVFDVTFLMLARVAHCFGGEVVKAEASAGSLVEAWVTDMMLEEGKVKPMAIVSQVIYLKKTCPVKKKKTFFNF